METSQARKYAGVFWDKRRQKWSATIKNNGHNSFLGYFKTQGEAINARIEAEKLREPKRKERLLFEQKVCDLYAGGLSMEKIGELVGKHQTSILDILKKHGVESRDIRANIDDEKAIRMYESGLSFVAIAKEMGVTDMTIARRIEEKGIEKRPNRHYLIREDFFENIDTEIKAYSLGLWMADGNVSKNLRVASISLTESDSYLLNNIAKHIFLSDFYLTRRGEVSLKGKEGHLYVSSPALRLNVCSKTFCQNLIKWGCVPKKSLTLRWPEGLPENMYGHFLRGYFDGDGTICKEGNRSSMISSDIFCASMARFLQKLGIESRIVVRGKVSQIEFKKKATVQMYDLMYTGHTICLERKRERFRV